MAGVKGRSGGARKGAGRKPRKMAQPVEVVPLEAKPTGARDPLAFLLSVMEDENASAADRLKAATAALPFVHPKPGGKKPAEKGSGGRFKAATPPKLVVNNR